MRATGIGGLSYALLSLVLLLAVWQLAAAFADPRVLPPPGAVAIFVWRETLTGELPFHLGMTLLRVIAAFVLAMGIGTAIGVWLGRSPVTDRLFDPWLILLLNLPALVVIVLAYIWFGLTEAAAIGAVALNKIPNAIVTIREGARALDRQFLDVAQVYRFNWLKQLRHVVLPQLFPYIAAASRSGIALIWKIVLVVELLGRPNGVGFQINLYFQLFDVAAILGYALAFVVVMLAVELVLVRPIEAHAHRWRPRPA